MAAAAVAAVAAATAASDALSVLAKVGITSKAIPDAIADATAAVVAAALDRFGDWSYCHHAQSLTLPRKWRRCSITLATGSITL